MSPSVVNTAMQFAPTSQLFSLCSSRDHTVRMLENSGHLLRSTHKGGSWGTLQNSGTLVSSRAELLSESAGRDASEAPPAPEETVALPQAAQRRSYSYHLQYKPIDVRRCFVGAEGGMGVCCWGRGRCFFAFCPPGPTAPPANKRTCRCRKKLACKPQSRPDKKTHTHTHTLTYPNHVNFDVNSLFISTYMVAPNMLR